MTDTTPETVIDRALAAYIKAEAKRESAAGAVRSALEDTGHLFENGWVCAVEVHHARLAVQTVQAYGLTITLDAHGNAVTVSSEDGFMITEVPE